MLKQGVRSKIVQERLGHSSIQITLDTHSHVVPGLQQAAAEGFDKMLNRKAKNEAVKNSVSYTSAHVCFWSPTCWGGVNDEPER